MPEPRGKHPGTCNEWCKQYGCGNDPPLRWIDGAERYEGFENPYPEGERPYVDFTPARVHAGFRPETDTLPPPNPTITVDRLGDREYFPGQTNEGYTHVCVGDDFWMEPARDGYVNADGVRISNYALARHPELRRMIHIVDPPITADQQYANAERNYHDGRYRDDPEINGLRNIVTEDIKQRYARHDAALHQTHPWWKRYRAVVDNT